MACPIKKGKGNLRVIARKICHQRVCKHISGALERPRLVAIRPNRHMVAQVVDGIIGHILYAAPTLEEAAKGVKGHKVGAVHKVGELIAERAKILGIEAVAFDCEGNKYHGHAAVVVEGAREGGLKP